MGGARVEFSGEAIGFRGVGKMVKFIFIHSKPSKQCFLLRL